MNIKVISFLLLSSLLLINIIPFSKPKLKPWQIIPDVKVSEINYPYGDIILYPEPQKVIWKDGAFLARVNNGISIKNDATERTLKTIEIFKRKYFEHTGIKLNVNEFSAVMPNSGIIMEIAPSARFNGKHEKLKKQGYYINVYNNKVKIIGFDEPGLYYGMITFFQIMDHTGKIKAKMPVKNVEILDWPELYHRHVRLMHSAIQNTQEKSLEYLEWWIDNYVAKLKYNNVSVGIDNFKINKRRPEFKKGIYTYDKLSVISEYCKDNFVEFVPYLSVGGRGYWIMNIHPELREKGYRWTMDLTHPDLLPILKDVFLDVIEAAKPKYIFIAGDELWHFPIIGPGLKYKQGRWFNNRPNAEQPEDKLRGKTHKQAYLEFYTKLNAFFRKHNVKMMMYQDMLDPYQGQSRHPRKVYKIASIADQMPKDIVIMIWSGGGGSKKYKYFASKGFEIWTSYTGPNSVSSEDRKYFSGWGVSSYSSGEHMHSLIQESYNGSMDICTIIHYSGFAWKFKTRKYEGENHTKDEKINGKLITLKNYLSLKPNPYAGESILPIDISKSANNNFNKFLEKYMPFHSKKPLSSVNLDKGIKEIGFIPTGLLGNKGKNCIIMEKNSGNDISIMINNKFSSLIFLHTDFVDEKNPKKGFRGRQPEGFILGNYEITYSDGTKENVPINHMMNIKRLNVSSFMRACMESRYTYTVKDNNGNDVHFFQYEWVNLHPDKKISKVLMKHGKKYDIQVALMAISGREVFKFKKE